MVDDALEAARERRKRMYKEMLQLEYAVQAPARSEGWIATLSRELHDLSNAIDAHITTVEADDGIIDRVVGEAPRLNPQAKALREDHVILRRLSNEAVGLVDGVEGVPDEEQSEAIRLVVLELIRGLSRHRHRGSDFVWEGYAVDIGGLG